MGTKVLAGRYEIFEKIGEGGMAVVYKARDKLLNRYVAIKILRPEYVKDTAFVDSFRRESQSAAGLSHPNIVNVYDVGREGNIHYIVMELVEGITLSQLIKEKGSLDYKQTITFGKQIASALSLAHKNHIIHRDVKPQNVLVTQDGVAKLTDFGIAKAATDATIVTQPNTVMGSVHYFSPEQARGQYVDEKSDIYSLGIMLYEMITGRVPFDADNAVTIGIMHMNDAIVPPSKLVDGVPPGLEQIILKATEKYQVNRFGSVDEMLAALDNVNFITGMIDDPKAAGYARPAAAAAAGMAAANSINNKDDEDHEPMDEDDMDEDDLDDMKRNKKRQKKQQQKAKKARKDAKKKANKPLRKYKALAIILAIVLAIPLSYLAYSGINMLISGSSKVEVPNVTGKTVKEAEKILKDANLQMREGAAVASDEYKVGEIVNQNPPAGEKVEENSVVRVDVCSGNEGDIPHVVGMTKDAAKAAIEAAGFEVGTISYEDSALKKDTVLSQSPESGAKADIDAKIDLVLSNGQGKEEVSVPNLGGMTKSEAKSALEAVGLKLGSAGTAESSTYKKGQVMSQNPSAGTKIAKGKSVNITISSGPASAKSVSIYVSFDGAPTDADGNFKMSVIQENSEGSMKTIMSNKSYNISSGGTTITVSGTNTATVTVKVGNAIFATYKVNFKTGTYS